MLSVSGQNNAYKFNLHNGLDSSPVANILMHTDRNQIAGNYITLGIRNSLMVKASLVPVNTYVTVRLQSLGARLVTRLMPAFANEVLAGRAAVNDEAPSYIKVSNYVNARRVIDDLFAHNEMSAVDRADMENALHELEKSAQFASKRAESITVAQKEVIQSVVSPYVDDIKSEAPDSETAKSWIRCAGAALSTCGPTSAKINLSSFLWTACRSGNGKSEDFYESLFAISKIYSNMGDLEGAFEQLGETLPSKALVQQTILDLFDSSSS